MSLREKLEYLRKIGAEGCPPDPGKWVTFHMTVERVASEALAILDEEKNIAGSSTGLDAGGRPSPSECGSIPRPAPTQPPVQTPHVKSVLYPQEQYTMEVLAKRMLDADIPDDVKGHMAGAASCIHRLDNALSYPENWTYATVPKRDSAQPVELGCIPAFEAWAKSVGIRGYDLTPAMDNDGDHHYRHHRTWDAWEGWRAAWQSRPKRESGKRTLTGKDIEAAYQQWQDAGCPHSIALDAGGW